ncbi:hypothetical protein P9F15_28505 [Bacillus cereus]|uniref:hypothetical protein n=1 Tax=Bacillus TaxID=1386 RepID=UPI0018CE2B25|nr:MULTISPECIES: hypothetical protein [Bacillus]MBG9715267.1 hypothetical protein [Bacillus cereus]MCI4251507.1 hypothetical protein [Bacillus sp. CCB-MMP212]MDA2520129.1 hypothetical protein [Bacillus cereus]MEC1984268.1 hypothetical protein [Bacillus cereus]
MYQNFQPYHYHNNSYQFRIFERLVGEFFTTLKPIKVPQIGHVIPAGTRVFIHKVDHDQAGQEIVTMVFPFESTIMNGHLTAAELSGRV